MTYRKVVVSSKRHVHTYVYLYQGARWSIEQAEASEEGRFYNCLSAIILSAFCLEAYLNHLGSKLLPYWDNDIKRDLNAKNKLRILCNHINLGVNFSCSPFQSFPTIFKFRNLMAHGKTETLSEEGVQKVAEGHRVKHPETWWETQCRLETAKRLLADAEAMVVEINQAAGYDEHPFLFFGSAVASVSIA